jgi:phage-related protein
MATFPSIAPTFGAQKQSAPKIRKTQFGDGYQQRMTFGLNQNPKVWSLVFMVKDADATTIENFLDARAADAESFDWTPPKETTSYKWTCMEWTRELMGDGFNSINATFSQVFEP